MDHVKGALEPLLPKVDELLKLVECKMQIDLNKEVEPPEPDWESVKTELVSLQSKLQYLKTEGRYIEVELGKSPSSRLAIKVWAEVRELSYDVEDVVDNYLLCLEGSEPIPDIDTLKQLVQKMTDLDLWEKIPADAMINDAAAARPASSTRSIDPKVQAMYTDIPHLVGMRGSIDSLIDMISDVKVAMPSRNKPKIACVVGFGGLGKTTLVRTLYDKIKKDFSCKAFVSVGQNGSEKKVLMDILLDLDKEKKEKNYTTYGLERLDVMGLLKELQEFLCKKRYLIVIDDMGRKIVETYRVFLP